jgi:hypothetical protein
VLYKELSSIKINKSGEDSKSFFFENQPKRKASPANQKLARHFQ